LLVVANPFFQGFYRYANMVDLLYHLLFRVMGSFFKRFSPPATRIKLKLLNEKSCRIRIINHLGLIQCWGNPGIGAPLLNDN
jgi:hypothetical protein